MSLPHLADAAQAGFGQAGRRCRIASWKLTIKNYKMLRQAKHTYSYSQLRNIMHQLNIT